MGPFYEQRFGPCHVLSLEGVPFRIAVVGFGRLPAKSLVRGETRAAAVAPPKRSGGAASYPRCTHAGEALALKGTTY